MSGQDFDSLKGLAFDSTSSYTIVEEIGRGGMGIVFLAEKHAEGVTDYVVLKTLKTLSPRHVEMLKKEANIATGLRHENIVKTYGLEAVPYSDLPSAFTGEVQKVSFEHAGRKLRVRRLSALRHTGHAPRPLMVRRPPPPAVKKDDRKLYMLVMDYVEGTDLGDLHHEHLERGLLLPVPLAAFAISRICRALAYAHETCIHRDISPENILINNQGVSKLSDFGVAAGGAEQMTLFAGKLSYMAPEQLDQQPADSRTDLYALGLVAYQILTGILLHPNPRGVSPQEQYQYVRRSKQEAPLPPNLVRRDIPEILSNLVMKMIALNPQERYWRAEDAGNALEQKFLYASGFGPTNNSLAAYLSLFDAKFQGATQDQLTQLRFLAGADNKVHLQRAARTEDYTKAGLDLVKRRPGTLLHKRLFAPAGA
jgi:serine/threonine protein kinase